MPSRIAFALGVLLTACSKEDPPESAPPTAALAENPQPAEMAGLNPASWVRLYDPARAFNGLTLALYERRLPILLDMNGQVVHSWPEARVRSRVRLLGDGSLLAIGKGRQVVEYNWDGELTWEYRPPHGLPHHDVIRLRSGHTLLVVRSHESAYDRLLEVDREGQVVWDWHSEERLEIDPQQISNPEDVTHINSVQELPPNPWFDSGDSRFRPGNLLVSARNLNRIFIIDRSSGDVVWAFDEQLDWQHEALMIEPGLPGHGNVLVFSNGTQGRYVDRQSAVLEIRPTDGSVLWAYRAEEFYARTGGLEQPLPNGNVLIVSADRTFEIDRRGEIVWQWVPPFRPTRTQRYAADHCPQLAALVRGRQPSPVRPSADTRHVDLPVYLFAYRPDREELRLEGEGLVAEDLVVLKSNHECRRLLVPARSRLDLSYGLLPRSADDDAFAIRFAATLERPSGSPAQLLIEEVVVAPDAQRREHSFDLSDDAYQWVRLCVVAEGMHESEIATEPRAYWVNPQIVPEIHLRSISDAAQSSEGLTPEEMEVRRQHLEALGYVD